MARLIDKKTYMIKLQEVMNNLYHGIDYRKISQYALKPEVAAQMSGYVMEKYGEYYSDKIQMLLKESHALLEECLNELGMTK